MWPAQSVKVQQHALRILQLGFFLPCGSSMVSTQNIASISADCALGPGAPWRNAIFEVPPPEAGGLSGTVDIFKVVVEIIFCPWIACASTTLGLSTMACVTLGMSAAAVRKFEAFARVDSGKGTRFPGFPMANGVMLTGANGGAPLRVGSATPCATKVVPWGISPIRATVGGSCGFVVCGIVTHRPGST